jgi:hypothetical protein
MRKNVILLGIGIMFSMSVSVLAATNGVQTFDLLFKSGDVLWIGEDIGGEYELSVLHQVVVRDDGVAAGQSELKTYRQWAPIAALDTYVRTDLVIRLESLSDGRWGHSDLTWTLRPPDEDKTLTESFIAHVQAGGSNAESFYAAKQAPAKQPPLFRGADAEPLYFSDRGLFFNYTIDSSYIFFRSGLVLVFTHQPAKAVGLDTMHGFIVMRFNSSSGQ